MTAPLVGRMVRVIGPVAEANGADEAPAIITRVWSDTMVNVTVFPDNADVRRATSVRLFETEAEAREHAARTDYPMALAFWPARV